MDSRPQPVVLSIAGSDSGGGAGIQADLLTIHANGGFPTTAITCLTAQNPDGVSGIEVLSAEFIREQIEQVARYFPIKVIKTGMLFNADIIETVAEYIATVRDIQVVVDPVMVATSGAVLLEESAVHALREHLLPKATLLTPNLDEAAVLIGHKPETVEQMKDAAHAMAKGFQTAILLKGGHLENTDELVDLLAPPDGPCVAFKNPRIEGINTHGSGCTLASAIATHLAHGHSLEAAIQEALNYLQKGMRHPSVINGTSFIRH